MAVVEINTVSSSAKDIVPEVSIIIPLYNAEKYIYQCLKSIDSACGASLSNYEVIIVDDGSTDNSLSIVEEFTSSHNNFRIIKQENKGTSSARMNGLSVAKGDFIWFIDSDDYLISGALDTVMQLLKKHPVDVLMIQIQMYDENTGNRWIKAYAPVPEGFISGKEYLQRPPTTVTPVQFIIKRLLFDNPDIRFPEGFRHEDEYFSRVLQYNSTTMYVSDEPLYVYRLWGGSFMHTNTIRHRYDIIEIYKLLDDFVRRQVDIKDVAWFRRDIFSFLMGAYFWYTDLFDGGSFNEFHQKNKFFIRRELRNNAQYFSQKERWIDTLMLYCPKLFSRLLKLKHETRLAHHRTQ